LFVFKGIYAPIVFQDNLFHFDVEKEVYGLKPMNCPGHWWVLTYWPLSQYSLYYVFTLPWFCLLPWR